ncbi:MAG: class I SAM-dependent methyltransferase [Parachlamydiaceae bacterium]|nr:class I SAM-dependent methyltransferase [Parachlamydiaceae bacterium]
MFSKIIFNFAIFSVLLLNSTLVGSNISDQNRKAYEYLDNLAIAAGTDKSSTFHNYTKVYAKYFDSLRNDKIKFLEIGINKGFSAKLWESYFTDGDLHFVDIDKINIQYYSPRAHYHFVDQTNFTDLTKLVKSLGGNFDIIIDDGGHTMHQQIMSFQTLFPYVKNGGIYVIEDLHTSYWQEYGGGGQIGAPARGKGTCIEFLKERIDDLNYTAGVTACADFDKVPYDKKKKLNYYHRNIDSIHFYQSLCIIIKK